MIRIAHGDTSPLAAELCPRGAARFDYLFPDLAITPEALLPEVPETLDNLARLGDSMRDETSGGFSNIPSAYTYFGQFVDHDITFTCTPKNPPDLPDSCVLDHPHLAPLPVDFIRENITNRRAAVLQLDSVYGGEAARDENDDRLMKLGKVVSTGRRPPEQDEDKDLPRWPVKGNDDDRAALIGDQRNDQHLILSQLHVAFLRAHNQVIRQEQCSFAEARTLLRKHYQWIVINDFLKKQLADENTVEAVIADPVYKPTPDDLYVPLEFTVAAFRFGHSMVRKFYYLNFLYPSSDLRNIFTLAVLGNNPGLPDHHIIEWEGLLRGLANKNMAHSIDTQLVEPLRHLLDEHEMPVPCETRLAVQDLKRGYMMRIPTGQAMARAFGLQEMSEQEVEDSVPEGAQRTVLRDSGFSGRTPLWFYILAEAKAKEGGYRLGPLGRRLVAEVLVGLVRVSDDSILPEGSPRWTPTLKSKVTGQFDLADLLGLAGMLKY